MTTESSKQRRTGNPDKFLDERKAERDDRQKQRKQHSSSTTKNRQIWITIDKSVLDDLERKRRNEKSFGETNDDDGISSLSHVSTIMCLSSSEEESGLIEYEYVHEHTHEHEHDSHDREAIVFQHTLKYKDRSELFGEEGFEIEHEIENESNDRDLIIIMDDTTYDSEFHDWLEHGDRKHDIFETGTGSLPSSKCSLGSDWQSLYRMFETMNIRQADAYEDYFAVTDYGSANGENKNKSVRSVCSNIVDCSSTTSGSDSDDRDRNGGCDETKE